MSVLLWGFTTSDLKSVATRLRKAHPDWLWVSKGTDADLMIRYFHEFDGHRLLKFHSYTHSVPPVRLSPDERMRCYAVMHREFHAAELEQGDMRDILGFFESYFSSLLRHYQIKTVAFSMIPHLGPELVLFYVAKRLGLRVKMFYQSLFSDRFFDVGGPDELGQLPLTGDGAWPKLTEKFTYGPSEHDWFYMRNIEPMPPLWRWRTKRVGARLKKWVRGKTRSLGVLSLAASDFQHRRYAAEVVGRSWSFGGDIENTPYVYFALHMQPELTTDPLGGKFGDQALAIEALRKWLPPDVAILVKENPKQSHEWRDPWFYERLLSLDNVHVIDRRVNTHRLLCRSLMVATVSGTVGWESILAGKPVIIFGSAWYSKLPGAFRFASELNFSEVSAFLPDFERLERLVGQLSTHMPLGVVDMDYLPICTDYSQSGNEARLQGVLSDLP